MDKYGNGIDTTIDIELTKTLTINNPFKVVAVFGDSIFIDNFFTDKGWVTDPYGTDDADPSGVWERNSPWHNNYQFFAKKPPNDLVTGYRNSDTTAHDIDGGVTSIESPIIPLPSSGSINISFYYYLLHDNQATNDDYLQVIIRGSADLTILDVRGYSEEKSRNTDEEWEYASFDISGFAGENIKILIKAADNANENIVEAGFDYVRIISY